MDASPVGAKKASSGVGSSPYLALFRQYRIYREFLPGGRFFALRRKNTFWKEISEAMAVRERIKRIVVRNRARVDFVVDVGCGKGFLALLTALFHPHLRVYAVDVDRNPNWEHFRKVSNIEARYMDIMSASFERWLYTLEGRGILAGIHLCTYLSLRFIDLYNRLANIGWAILVPCCVGQFDWVRFAWLYEERGPYEAWVAYLATLPVGRVVVRRDPGILSDKNFVIQMQKGWTYV